MLADADGHAGRDPHRHRLGGAPGGRGARRRWPTRASRPAWSACRRWELFEAQPAAYRDAVLPPAGPRARVAVEAGVSAGWEKYVGASRRDRRDLDRFGASAPPKVVMEKYGFTADNVAAKAAEVVAQLPARLAALGLKKA